MMELFGVGALVTVVVAMAWAAAALVLPLAWLWMLVDALFREPADYPDGTENEKVIWVIFMAIVQPIAIAYFFLVFRAIPRGSRSSAHLAQPTQPISPTA